MRILWFTNNQANYKSYKNSSDYNGGGWMSALQDELIKQPNIALGVCFCKNGEPQKVIQDNVCYYPIPHHVKSPKNKILDFIYYNDAERDKHLWSYYINSFRKIIDDFKPDVIEIFGSELYVGLASIAAKGYPTILHIQGVLSLYIYTFLPPGVSKWQYIWKDRSIKSVYNNFQTLIYWKRSCVREKAILKAVSHVIGRTNWDKTALSLLNPNAKYHYGGEILRPEFYETSIRKIPSRITIISTISSPPYKGYDLILKTANILKNELNIDFEWNVFGNISPFFFEKHLKLNHNNLNIKLRGVASAKQLRDSLLYSTLYFHPSYIENSSNGIAEAQILGIPVVATNVGGTPSMVKNGYTGYLFPATDPYMAAYHIIKLSSNLELNQNMGNTAKKIAINRHNKIDIVNNLLKTYENIMKE